MRRVFDIYCIPQKVAAHDVRLDTCWRWMCLIAKEQSADGQVAMNALIFDANHSSSDTAHYSQEVSSKSRSHRICDNKLIVGILETLSQNH